MTFSSSKSSTDTTMKSLVRSAEQEMKTSKSEAYKTCRQVCRDADAEYEREQARISKIRSDAQNRAQKEEETINKQLEEQYVQQVLSLVTNAIVNLKEEQFRKEQEESLVALAEESLSSPKDASSDLEKKTGTTSTLTPTSSAETRGSSLNGNNGNGSSKPPHAEDPQIKALIRFATDKLSNYNMYESQVSQRLLEAVATEIVARQLRAQQAAFERSQALERELESLRVQDAERHPPPAYNPEHDSF